MDAEALWALYASFVDWFAVTVVGQVEARFEQASAAVDAVSWSTAAALLGFFTLCRLVLMCASRWAPVVAGDEVSEAVTAARGLAAEEEKKQE
jgi:hypothetical protein